MIKLTKQQEEFIKNARRTWESFNKTHIAQRVNEEFWTKFDLQNLRRKVWRVVKDVSNPIADTAMAQGICPSLIEWWWTSWETEDWQKISLRFRTRDEQVEEFRSHVDSFLENYKFSNMKVVKAKWKNNKMCKVTLSDEHVWLDPDPKGLSMFWYKYNEEIYRDWLKKVFNSILEQHKMHWTFDVLCLQNLWDHLDWWWGETTRWWHKLPQNMSNTKAMMTFCEWRIWLISNILRSWVANTVKLIDVVNDNHSWDFWEIASYFVRRFIQGTFWENAIETMVVKKMMEHYSYGKHTFIVTHGKDAESMTRPMPLILNEKTVNHINRYIRHAKINNEFIHLEKWDQHRLWFQKADLFDYRNHMSFAPWSYWQQLNFSSSYAWYWIDIVHKDSHRISHEDYFINYESIE